MNIVIIKKSSGRPHAKIAPPCELTSKVINLNIVLNVYRLYLRVWAFCTLYPAKIS
jgi:hypothetical protein